MPKPSNTPEYVFDTRWFKAFPDKDREEIKKIIIGDQKVLDILVKMMYNIVRSKERVVVNDYDSPSWSHKQAHLNGELDMLRSLIKIVDIHGKTEPNQE